MARKSAAKRQQRKGTMRRMKGGMTTGEHGISVYGDANQQTAVGNGSNVIRMHNPAVPMQGGKRMHGGDEPTAASILKGAEELLNNAKKLIVEPAVEPALEQVEPLTSPLPVPTETEVPAAASAEVPVPAQGGAISDWFGLGNKEETAEPVAEPATEEPAPEQPVAEQPVEPEQAWYGGKKKNAGMLAIPRMLLDMTPLRSERQSAKRQKRVNKKGKSAKKRM
jgi:hypothetical protein